MVADEDGHAGPSSGGDCSGTVPRAALSSLRLMGERGTTAGVVANERDGVALEAVGKGIANKRSGDSGAAPRKASSGAGPSTCPCPLAVPSHLVDCCGPTCCFAESR